MSAQIGRDAVDGYIWLYGPSLIKSGGPERVATEDPPDDWQPAPFLGFTTPSRPEVDPLLWDGDQA